MNTAQGKEQQPLTKKALIAKLKLLDLADDETKKKVVCALIGHSNICSFFFGYHYCGRCGDQVGDSLGSYYENPDEVIIGHKDGKCEICKDNFKKMTWHDKFMVPDPFKEED